MKKIIALFSVIVILAACKSDDDATTNCRFLLDVGVNFPINLDLPQYSNLQFVSNSVFIPNIGGNAGIIVINTGSGYLAWDGSDPTHPPTSCSRLNVSGFTATSGCQGGNQFSLATGQPLTPGLACGLKNYRVSVNGNTLLITN